MLFWGHVLGQLGHYQSAHQAPSAYISLCICRSNFVKIGPSATKLWRHTLFNMAAAASQFYFRFRNLPAYQISARYLNPRLRYNYFRFLKTNVRHVGILLPVRIITFASPSACHSASAYQISSKSDHPRRSYDVISIIKMAARASQFYFRFHLS